MNGGKLVRGLVGRVEPDLVSYDLYPGGNRGAIQMAWSVLKH